MAHLALLHWTRTGADTHASADSAAWQAVLAGRGYRSVDTAAEADVVITLDPGTDRPLTVRSTRPGRPTTGPAEDLVARTGRSSPAGIALTDDGGHAVATVTEPLDPTRPTDVELVVNLVAWSATPDPTPSAAPTPIGTRTVDRHWQALKATVGELQTLQAADGSVPDAARHPAAARLVGRLRAEIDSLAPHFAHDADYLAALGTDLQRWAGEGFAVPDFLDSLMAFHPEQHRVDGLRHLVVFPMYTQNGSTNRFFEAVLLEVIWPDFVDRLEQNGYSNALFVPVRFLDFTAGYDTNSAVLFPETVAMRSVPKFTWGAIFADREAARFRRVADAAAATTGLALPPEAARLLADQQLAEETFVMWDLIHDRTHMHGDLPFDPFMIKQRMPYFLYSLEELRCDLTAFREAVRLEGTGIGQARLVQYAILMDRIFRFAITGSRVRNYDGLGGQLLFAWLHQHRVLHWTDNRLTIEWENVTAAVLALGESIDDLYWRSIDRPKIVHWLAAHALISTTLTAHPASAWAAGTLPLDGPPKGLTDAVLPDEFPLSMFYEALSRKLSDVVGGTAGITGRTAVEESAA